MPSPITEVTVNFTYNIADSMYSQSMSQNKTATATYTGPDRCWIFVDTDTGVISSCSPPLTTVDNGAEVPTPVGTTKVEIVAADDPLVMSLVFAANVSVDGQTTTQETLPCGHVLEYNTITEVDQTYERDSLTYDIANASWNTPDLVQAPYDWTWAIEKRNNALTASDGKISPDMPDAVKQPWIDYRQSLRDLPATYGYGTADEVEAWKIYFPLTPEEG
jgi:hypothetical protein